MIRSRDAQKAATKNQILSAAYHIFAEKGFVGSRMQDVAVAAGVSHGSVFAHFGSQEGLVTSVVQHYSQIIAQTTHQLAAHSLTVKQLLAAHLDSLEKHEQFYTHLMLEKNLLPSSAKDCYIAMQSVIANHFNIALQQDTHLRPSNPPIYFLFNAWIGMLHHYFSNKDLFAPSGSIVARYKEELIDNFTALLY